MIVDEAAISETILTPTWTSIARRLGRLKSFRFPILSKDLREQAARRRTYVIRFVYALALFVAGCTLLYANIGTSASAGSSLGRGLVHFQSLIGLQVAALYLLVPVLTAGAVAAEKERETLVLLLISTLTPRQIILQKFASRMMPALTFLCLSFPLLAITYAFGGVTVGNLITGILMLVSTCLALGALAIACSAFFRTTVQAIGATYLIFAICGFFFPGIFLVLDPAAALDPGSISFTAVFGLVFTPICLIFAESVVVPRAFVPHRNYFLELFRWLDSRFEEMNVVTGGVVLVRDRGVLPETAPIRWRETRKRSLGTFRYLFRVLVVLEFPIIFAGQSIRLGGGPGGDGGMTFLLNCVWIASAVLVCIHTAGVISEERARQTFDVLLSTPLSAQRIISEKLGGVRRLLGVLMAPFFSIFAFEHWWYARSSFDYVVLSVLTVVTYLSLMQWLALWIGLRMRSQLPAIVTALMIVAGWTVATASVMPLAQYLRRDPPWLPAAVLVLSPVDMIEAVQHSAQISIGLSPAIEHPIATAAHFVIYGGLAVLFWRLCRYNADRRLGRLAQPANRIAETSLM